MRRWISCMGTRAALRAPRRACAAASGASALPGRSKPASAMMPSARCRAGRCSGSTGAAGLLVNTSRRGACRHAAAYHGGRGGEQADPAERRRRTWPARGRDLPVRAVEAEHLADGDPHVAAVVLDVGDVERGGLGEPPPGLAEEQDQVAGVGVALAGRLEDRRNSATVVPLGGFLCRFGSSVSRHGLCSTRRRDFARPNEHRVQQHVPVGDGLGRERVAMWSTTSARRSRRCARPRGGRATGGSSSRSRGGSRSSSAR
jgi:hypothetical protein